MPEPQQDARLAALAAFLQKAPALAGIRPIWVDNLPAQPFSAGLFPGGRQPRRQGCAAARRAKHRFSAIPTPAAKHWPRWPAAWKPPAILVPPSTV